MATYVITQGIQGPEGAQGPPGEGSDLFALDGITDGQIPVWDAELGKFVPAIDELAGNPDVITIYMIVNEADVFDVLGLTFTPGVSISPVMAPPGLRFLVAERAEEQERTVYRSYTSNGDGLAIYDTDQLMDSASVFTTDSEAEVAFTQGPLLFVMSSNLPGQNDGPSVFKPFKIENDEYLQLIGPSIGDFAGNVIYDNTDSGLTADNAQAALDELAATIQEALDIVDGLDLGASSYTPADSANWTGADPTTIAEAIDRIAAALGPIA